VIEALARVTPDKRVGAALEALGEASEAFAEGAYHRAVRKAQQAKDLAPRDTTVRETLGLAAYRTGDWQTALAELRTFRRLAGETTHLPVEMDVLRALGRGRDVETAWQTLQERGGKPAVLKEGAVVYGSHLIDEGDLDGAWAVVAPRRLRHDPFPEDLRLWYVAARVAALRGDAATAGKLRNDILENDPGFPGIDELEKLIASV
jgi:tetratricopeptide (TPR) repeat protein